MALGLRFAGSANSDAFDCLYEFAKTFMKMMSFAGTAAVGAVSILFFYCIYSLLTFQIQYMQVKQISLTQYFLHFFLVLVLPTDGLLQPANRSVNDFVGYVHGHGWHREPEGSAALSLLSQENWW